MRDWRLVRRAEYISDCAAFAAATASADAEGRGEGRGERKYIIMDEYVWARKCMSVCAYEYVCVLVQTCHIPCVWFDFADSMLRLDWEELGEMLVL